MEEILASIRRIIADDQGKTGAEEVSTTPLSNVLDLTDRHFSPLLNAAPAQHRLESDFGSSLEDEFQDDGFSPSVVSTCQMDPPAPPRTRTGRPAAEEPSSPEPLLSGEADAAVADAFGRLASIPAPAQAPPMGMTVEDLLREMLRPLLKQWLDSHLPPLVERLVQVEIERVTRGRA